MNATDGNGAYGLELHTASQSIRHHRLEFHNHICRFGHLVGLTLVIGGQYVNQKECIRHSGIWRSIDAIRSRYIDLGNPPWYDMALIKTFSH